MLLKCLPIRCQKIKLNCELFLLIFRTNVFSSHKCENGMLHHNALWFFFASEFMTDWRAFFSIWRPSGKYFSLNGPNTSLKSKVEAFWWTFGKISKRHLPLGVQTDLTQMPLCLKLLFWPYPNLSTKKLPMSWLTSWYINCFVLKKHV